MELPLLRCTWADAHWRADVDLRKLACEQWAQFVRLHHARLATPHLPAQRRKSREAQRGALGLLVTRTRLTIAHAESRRSAHAPRTASGGEHHEAASPFCARHELLRLVHPGGLALAHHAAEVADMLGGPRAYLALDVLMEQDHLQHVLAVALKLVLATKILGTVFTDKAFVLADNVVLQVLLRVGRVLTPLPVTCVSSTLGNLINDRG